VILVQNQKSEESGLQWGTSWFLYRCQLIWGFLCFSFSLCTTCSVSFCYRKGEMSCSKGVASLSSRVLWAQDQKRENVYLKKKKKGFLCLFLNMVLPKQNTEAGLICHLSHQDVWSDIFQPCPPRTRSAFLHLCLCIWHCVRSLVREEFSFYLFIYHMCI
jgi:hypothetical protein